MHGQTYTYHTFFPITLQYLRTGRVFHSWLQNFVAINQTHVFPLNLHVTMSGKLPKALPLPILHRPYHEMTLGFFCCHPCIPLGLYCLLFI